MSGASISSHLAKTLGNDGLSAIKNSKILVVGSGGIGCELLKNLVLSGFEDIEIIDLDTIDLSNLNRQFLFQRKHIGLSKAQVAKEAVQRFNPKAKIVAHCANIKNAEFGPEYFQKFNLVLNALDNLDARRHVNRICIATEIPLIESGTAGYLGQVQPIKKGVTECYECQPKPAPKTYAYCTIRSNPKEPIHCIIWAKEEFNSYFGNPANRLQDEDTLSDDPEIKKEEEKLKNFEKKNYSEWLFHKLFYFDIFSKVRVSQVTGKNSWPDRDPPVPLTLQNALKSESTSKEDPKAHPDEKVWTIKESAEKFLTSVSNLKNRYEKSFLEFDKDDKDIMDFVTSSSNIRSYIFGIPLQSRFSVKSMAGNIIPAIATTNAIVAGLIVIEAIKILQNHFDLTRMVYLQKLPSRDRLFLSTESEKPNSACYVCSSHTIQVKLDVQKSTLSEFFDNILKKKLGFNEPSISIGSITVYECGEGLEEDEKQSYAANLKQTLKILGAENSSIIEVDDFSQKLKLNITLIHCDKETFSEEEEPYQIIGNQPQPIPNSNNNVQPPPEKTDDNMNISTEDDDLLIVEPSSAQSKKRKLPEEIEKDNATNAKRSKK